MTIADAGERTLLDGAAVDDFRALVARLGVMSSLAAVFGNGTGAITFPGRPFRLVQCRTEGDEQWLLVAGNSDVDPWSHVDGAPDWVRDTYDPTWQPQLVAWGMPLSWEISDSRRHLERENVLPPANLVRPWLTEGIDPIIEPALTDSGTIKHLPQMFPADEPDVLAGSDIDAIASATWNTLVCPEVTVNQQRLAASLRALGTHVQLAPLGLDRIDAGISAVHRLWNTYLPGINRPVQRTAGAVDVVARRGDYERHLVTRNTSFLWGWAIDAMKEAARAVPREQRAFGFDRHGLSVRDGEAWARLIGVSSERLVIVADSPGSASESRGSFIRPSWVPNIGAAYSGTVAWTVRGYWRGDHFTGPLGEMTEFSALSKIRPNQSLNLQAALSLVPEPVNSDARVELLGMMQGLQDFTWNGTVLAVRQPSFKVTPSLYRF